MKRINYRVELQYPDEDDCVNELVRVPRGCFVYAIPVMQDYRKFVQRVRGRAYKHGINVLSRVDEKGLRLWAWDRTPKYQELKNG